jgi:hypothetical protein
MAGDLSRGTEWSLRRKLEAEREESMVKLSRFGVVAGVIRGLTLTLPQPSLPCGEVLRIRSGDGSS